MNTFQWFAIPICFGLGIVAFIRRRALPGRASGMFWAFLWFSAATVIAVPGISTILARWAGIGRGADLILYIAALSGMLIARYLYCRQRRIEILLTDLARLEALRNPQRGANPAGYGPNLNSHGLTFEPDKEPE